MAFLLAKDAGSQSFVLVDTGHHYQAQNIEQIVAWLLHHRMMGGFHFNDRRYADDDLTLGSIDPYQVFRIFHEIRMFEWETKSTADIAYMIDQSHNLKDKIEAMIQTVCTAQELYARAALVDHDRLASLQQKCALVDAEETLRGAFWFDVRHAVREWRKSRSLPVDPLQEFRSSGYLERIRAERSHRNAGASASYA
jgi:L-rhamnose isomerase/sugar isomerase